MRWVWVSTIFAVVALAQFAIWFWWQRRKLKCVLLLAIDHAKQDARVKGRSGFDPEFAESRFYELCSELVARRKLSKQVVPRDLDERDRLSQFLIHAAAIEPSDIRKCCESP